MKEPREQSGQTLVGDLTRDIYEAAAAVRAVGEQIARTAKQSLARWQVLYLLGVQPLTVSMIARRLGLTRQSVQRVADELVGEHLLRTVQNPDHQRSPLLELTATGTDVLARINKQATAWHRQVLRTLSPAEIARGREFLRLVTELARPSGD